MPTEAFKIIAEADGMAGVSFLGLGEERDIVVVIGQGVDACNLAKSLRKKFKTTEIITVADAALNLPLLLNSVKTRESKVKSPQQNVGSCVVSL
ncbi:hypothetical protein GBA52_022034 [Prunus armeniaca]|nr:hypothetical protein GBA52_022034 [Prunus armeniaca]